MKRIFKIVCVVLAITILLTSVNCFAFSEKENNIENNKLIKKYEVQENEEQEFLAQIQKEFSDEEFDYTLYSQDKTGGSYIESKDITTSKTITLKTNNTEKILKKLPEKIEYNENGYKGEYIINTDSLKVKTNYNGYTEYLVEDNKSYSDLSRNDLDFIPKQVIKNGITLDLLSVNWKMQSTKMVGNYELADKYIAECYYAGKIRKDNPYTYTVTVNYKGIAEKKIEKPYEYTLVYSMKEQVNYNILYYVGGGTVGLIVIFFLFRKNAKVYNFRNGEYKFVGRIYIRKDKVKLTRFAPFEKSNKYKIEIANRKAKKLQNKLITIVKRKAKISKVVTLEDNTKPYTMEVTL